MANEENLKRIQSTEEAREKGRKGGIASGESRRRKKAFREWLEEQLESDGGNLNGQPATKKELIAARLVQKLLDGSVEDRDFLRAFEVVRDTIGEKPIDKLSVSTVDQETIDEVEAMVFEDDDNEE